MLSHLLIGSDLRRLNNKSIVEAINDQKTFDELFVLLFHHERSVVMRAIDAVEKISRKHPEFLVAHKNQLLEILKHAIHKELKWHVAQLISKVKLNTDELNDVWHLLTYWALNRNESKIVRVNSLQGLFDLSRLFPQLNSDFQKTLDSLSHESIPSIQARIRKILKTKPATQVSAFNNSSR